MADYNTRFVETCLHLFDEEIAGRVDGITSNKSMEHREVDYDRGYIAGLRRAAIVVGREVPKKLNEE